MRFFSSRSLIIILLCVFFTNNAKSQPFIPFSTWNHAGVTGVYLQPASIADTRMKFDMTLFGVDVNVGNSFYGMKKGFVTSGDWFDKIDEYSTPLEKIKNHRMQVGLDLQLLNFMVTLSPKSALAFHSRVRTMVNVDGVDPNLFDIMDNDISDFIGQSYTIKDMAFRANAWADFGVTYAREIMDWGPHYLKGGVTLKLVQPVTSGYIYIEDAGYSIKPNPNAQSVDEATEDVWLKAKGEMAMPSGFSDFEDFEDVENMFDDWKFGKNLGVGFDFGAVYEYRPNHENYRHPDNPSMWKRYEPSKYLFRIGLSVLDVGSMKYTSDWTQSFAMNTQEEIPEDEITDFDALRDAFGLKEQETKYRVGLPSAISIQTDWRIYQWLYLGVNPYFALRQKKGNKVGTHYMTSVNVTPRIEMAGLGFSLPITYDQFHAFNVGVGLQLGPLWVGSSNMFNMMFSNKLREINFCMGMKISIYHKNKNKSKSSNSVITDTIE